MDLLSTLLSYTALNMVDSSVWQISRGGNIIVTAFLSRIFLKRIFSGTSIFGCVLAFAGITSVQVVAVIYTDSSSSTAISDELIGIILLLASIIFNSIGLVYEKWIFNKYELSALKLVFLEGLYGLIVMVPLTFAFQYVHCPWSEGNCVKVNG
jgi:drug/metabolite transporter (DMT)-like permease